MREKNVIANTPGGSPDAPVGQLELLVGVDGAVRVEEEGEGETREAQHASRLAAVEQADQVEAAVTLQPLHVHVSPV